MTAMLGWAGTADFKEKWVFDGAAERCLPYVSYIKLRNKMT